MIVTWISVCFCYIGALVGAGFASGKEMQLFFTRFDGISLFSTCTAGFLFAFLAYATIILCQKKQITSLPAFFCFCLGKLGGKIMYRLLQLFLFFSVTVMIAASDNLYQVFFQGAPGTGGIFLCLLLFGSLFRPQKGMVVSNILLVPILMAMMIFLWHHAISFPFVIEKLQTISNIFTFSATIPFLWAILYVSYNFLGASAILVPFSQGKYKKAAAWGGFAAGILLGFLLVFGNLALLSSPGIDENAPMPFLAMAAQQKTGFLFYAFPLWAAIITTAIANSFAILQQSSFTQKGFFLILAFFIGYHWDFSGLVSFLYPFTGIGGLLLMFAIFYQYFRCR